jgi:hypothetical protein
METVFGAQSGGGKQALGLPKGTDDKIVGATTAVCGGAGAGQLLESLG